MNVFEAARQVSAVDAAERLGIPFKRTGKRGWARCVFHDDRTPSMMLYPENKGFYCFGCGASGDAISLYRHMHDCNAFEAAKAFCEDFNLPWEDDYRPSARAKPRKPDPRVLRMQLMNFRTQRTAMLKLLRSDAQTRMNLREKALSAEQIPFDEWWDDPEWAAAKAAEVEAGEELVRLDEMNMEELWQHYRKTKEVKTWNATPNGMNWKP